MIAEEAQRVEDYGRAGLKLEVDRQKLCDMVRQLRKTAAARRGEAVGETAQATS